MRVSIASPLMQPSPNGRRVGIRIVTFEACSGFTHVTARRIAQPPKATFVTRLQPSRLPGRAARQLPDQSTTLWVESSSTDDSRLRGARPRADIAVPDNPNCCYVQANFRNGPSMQPVTHYAKSGDVSIAYQVFGEGPINLVVVPGFVSNIENFWDQPDLVRWMLRMGSYARVVMFDKRGTGSSDRVAELPGLDQRMDDLRAVMDAAGMEQAAVLGVSEGGPLSALFAATYPARCRALVLNGSFARARQERIAAFLAYIDQAWGTGGSLPNSRPRARMIQPSNAGGAGSNGLARARPPRPPLCA